MTRAFVVHWDPAEIGAKSALVASCGVQVVGCEAEDGERAVAAMRLLDPNVLIVWLARLPSHGRVMAQAVRATAWGRTLPVVFVEGDPGLVDDAKMARIRKAVPDAVLATPDRLQAAVVQAMLGAREAQQQRLQRKAGQ
ncbi:MAG TPA: hypothetical protein VM286_03430 [Candidatus Thermoplasmatota archaeon]|nr:hypothetical protein [Candidatus Thermoplasmatota archaeon]